MAHRSGGLDRGLRRGTNLLGTTKSYCGLTIQSEIGEGTNWFSLFVFVAFTTIASGALRLTRFVAAILNANGAVDVQYTACFE